MVRLVNEERTEAGCRPLKTSATLSRTAQHHSDQMARTRTFSHTAPNGTTLSTRLKDARYRWSSVGENIARGDGDTRAVVDAWMRSPGHRANILNCDYREMGIGVHYGDGGPWWTQDFGATR